MNDPTVAAREAACAERLAALRGEMATLRSCLLVALSALEARRLADKADEAEFERVLAKAGLTPRRTLHPAGGAR